MMDDRSEPKQNVPYKHTIAGMHPWVYWSLYTAPYVFMIAGSLVIPKCVMDRTIEKLNADIAKFEEQILIREHDNGDEVFRRILRNVNDFAFAQNCVRMDVQYELLYADFVKLHASIGLSPPKRKDHLESEKIHPEVLYQETIDIMVASSQLKDSGMRSMYTRMVLENVETGKTIVPVPSSLEGKLSETVLMARTVLEGKTE